MTGQQDAAAHHRFGVLAERDFRLFFTGYSTSLVGAAMVPVASTFAVLQEGRPASDVGYVLAAETVPLVVLLLIGGTVADRLSRRAVMISADVMRCGYALAGPLATVLGVTGTLWLAAAWTVLASTAALAVPAVRRLGALTDSLAPDTV